MRRISIDMEGTGFPAGRQTLDTLPPGASRQGGRGQSDAGTRWTAAVPLPDSWKIPCPLWNHVTRYGVPNAEKPGRYGGKDAGPLPEIGRTVAADHEPAGADQSSGARLAAAPSGRTFCIAGMILETPRDKQSRKPARWRPCWTGCGRH